MDNLICVTPIEYDDRRKQIKRYYGYKIAAFSANELMETIMRVNVAVLPNIWEEEDTVFYQYPRKPLIAVKDGKLFTTEEMWNCREYSHKRIRHQASLLLRILKEYGLADYKKRTTISIHKFTPHKWR